MPKKSLITATQNPDGEWQDNPGAQTPRTDPENTEKPAEGSGIRAGDDQSPARPQTDSESDGDEGTSDSHEGSTASADISDDAFLRTGTESYGESPGTADASASSPSEERMRFMQPYMYNFSKSYVEYMGRPV